MKTLVAVLILAAASLPAAEPPNPLHDIPIAAPALRPQTEIAVPHIASDGENFFAVWADHRAMNTDVYGARFSASGELLDPEGRVVHATYENDSSPVAVWNGADYVTFSASGFLGTWNTLVSKSGEPRGAGGERLPQNAVPNAAAFNGSTYAQPLATYFTNGYRLELVLRDRELNIAHRVLLAENLGIGGVNWARVATDGRRFLVVSERQVEFDRIVEATIVDDDGTIVTPAFQLARASATPTAWATFSPDVAWNGTAYLVVMSAPDGVRSVPIATDGTRGAEKLVAAGSFINPAIAWDGHAHIVLWNVTRNFSVIGTRGAVVTATGDPVETFEVSDARPFFRPALASNGCVFLAIIGDESFVLRSTGPERIVRHGGPVSHAYPRQNAPAIAAGTTNFLTAWVEKGQELWIGRLSRRGAALDGGGIKVAEGFVTGVRVAAGRGFYVVSWVNSPGEIRIARVTELGEVLDPGGIVLAASGTLPAVASNGNETRLVWAQRNPVTQSPPLEMATATLPERGPVGAPSFVLPTGTFSGASRLFPNGAGYTLLFERMIPPACPQPRFCPIEFEYSSLALDEEGRPAAPVLVAPRGLFFDAAADERSIVITWYEGFSPRTRRLDRNGVPAAAIVDLPASPVPFQFPRFARTAGGFVLLLSEANVRAIHLDPDGRQVATTTLIQTDAPTVSDAVYADGQTWITYTSAWRPLPNAHGGGVARAWVHVMGPKRRAR